MNRAHLSVVYCITNACIYVWCVCVCVCVRACVRACVCSTDSADHLFVVCAFVVAQAIINYNQYSFGECAICITYTRKS